MKRAFSILASAATLFGAAVSAGPAAPIARAVEISTIATASDDQRMQWWRESRFGMFIHWGIYSVPAGTWQGKDYPGASEWIMDSAKIPISEYEPLAKQFNPTKFDAAKWVATAKDAGQKYIIITSKHHDGFCMWGTKETPYNIVEATPYKRDPLKDLAKECEKQGVKLGFYYSIMDWHHPDAKGANFPKYVEHMKKQLKELLSGEYGKVAVLWFDGEWIDEWTDEQGKDLYAYVRSLQPDIIINNRVGKGRDGMAGLNKNKDAPGDFGTPEQEIPPTGLPGVDWESCMTMNGSWGYHAGDPNWKSDTQLIRTLCETASKGGNFLLNVGPNAEGEIPAESVDRLAKVGAWMDVNHEAIYGTYASPMPGYYWGDATSKDGLLYLLVYEWPDDAYLRLRGMFTKVTKAIILATGVDRKVITHDYGTTIHIPLNSRDTAATVVKLTLEGPTVIRPRVIPMLDDSPTIILSVFDATIQGPSARLDRASDMRCLANWKDRTDIVSWDVDIKRAGLFKVIMFAACAGRAGGGGEYAVTMGGQETFGRVVSTGSWTEFSRFTPPPLTVTQPGRYTVQVRPTSFESGNLLMNLRGVYLQLHAEVPEDPSTPSLLTQPPKR